MLVHGSAQSQVHLRWMNWWKGLPWPRQTLISSAYQSPPQQLTRSLKWQASIRKSYRSVSGDTLSLFSHLPHLKSKLSLSSSLFSTITWSVWSGRLRMKLFVSTEKPEHLRMSLMHMQRRQWIKETKIRSLKQVISNTSRLRWISIALEGLTRTGKKRRHLISSLQMPDTRRSVISQRVKR